MQNSWKIRVLHFCFTFRILIIILFRYNLVAKTPWLAVGMKATIFLQKNLQKITNLPCLVHRTGI